MCGFCGFSGQVMNREEVLHAMAERITHRGPDSDGYYIAGEHEDDSIAMGFRRLSIIDLERGNQPIYNEDKSLVLMFNGEIYNYRALRTELIEKGHAFSTKTDSEVLLHGFEEWREELLTKLRGMFAFAIWNTVDHSLFIARDYFGINPCIIQSSRTDVLYLRPKSNAWPPTLILFANSMSRRSTDTCPFSIRFPQKPFLKMYIVCPPPTIFGTKTAR